jgi:hypothetical protein
VNCESDVLSESSEKKMKAQESESKSKGTGALLNHGLYKRKFPS